MPIRITSKQDGFRRCGIAHSAEPVEYKDGSFNEKDLETLKAESMLVVEVIEKKGVEVASKKDSDKKKG